MSTAAIVIIGDEILSGKFADENGPYLIRRLREVGCRLLRIAVVRDDLDAIAEEVRRCSALASRVITTGGVGPTHDDMTLEGVARAFDLPLELHPRVVELMQSWGMQIDASTERMARLPAGTVLLEGGEARFPVVRVRNVFVLPGVPRLMRRKFEDIAELFAGDAFHVARVATARHETDIAGILTAVQGRFSGVGIGSYPRYDDVPFRVIVTVEGRDPDQVEAAQAALLELIPDQVEP